MEGDDVDGGQTFVLNWRERRSCELFIQVIGVLLTPVHSFFLSSALVLFIVKIKVFFTCR